MTNTNDDNNALRQRGDITIWFTENAIAQWRPAKTDQRGRPIERSRHSALLIWLVFHLDLRQTEGFMNSVVCL